MQRTILSLFGALLLACLANGCASAKPEAMIPKNFVVEHRHPSSAAVLPPVPEAAKAKWTSQIASGQFTEALTQSLQESGLFATVLRTPEADYTLEVSFVKGDEPALGFDMVVDLVTRWVLTKKSTGESVFRENVSSTYTAKFGDAFAGGTRLRLANEGAARENIKEGIRRLSQLHL